MTQQRMLLTELLFLKKAAKIRKGELLRDKTVLAVIEKYIDAFYYNEMFYSAACWNTDAAVEWEMKNLNSK